MGTYLQPENFNHPNAADVVAIVEAEAKRVAPCLFGADLPADLDMEAVAAILSEAVRNYFATSGGRVKRRTTGPFTRELDTSGLQVFSDSSLSLLRGMCPAVDEPRPAGLPRGNFPPAGDYESLFAGIRYRRGH